MSSPVNDLFFLQDLAAVLSGDDYPDLAASLTPAATEDVPDPAPNIFAAQAAANTSRPILILHAPQGYQAFGPRRKGTIALELRGRQGDETAEGEHQGRWQSLYAALLGALGSTRDETAANQASAKAALIAAVNALGRVTLIDYGLTDNAIIAGVDGEDLQTVLQLRVAWAFQTV